MIQKCDAGVIRAAINDALEQGWERDRLHTFVNVTEAFNELTLRKGTSYLTFRLLEQDSGEIVGSENAIRGLANRLNTMATQHPD